MRRVIMVYRNTLAIAIAATLTGCGLSDNPVQTKFYASCEDHSKIAESVDWSKAETITVSYEDRGFSSALIEMEQGKPYILRIENTENGPHWFRAVDFFRDSAITKTLYNNQEAPSKCLEGLALAASSVAEVHLVPSAINNYEFEDSPFIVPALGELLWNSDTGYIVVR